MHEEQKKKRSEEDDIVENDNNKRFRGSDTVNSKNQRACNDMLELKSDIKDLKSSIQHLTNTLTVSLSQVTDNLKTLTSQVNELMEQNKEKDLRIQGMELRVNSLELQVNDMQQQMISKKIEIQNIQNKNIEANDVVKTIATSLNVKIDNHDISNAYRLKKMDDKIVVEFSTQNKKKNLCKMLNAIE